MSENNVEQILADLEAKVRQEIINWWNDVKRLRPETLPWFNNGIRGLVRKLYYNNGADNPDWKNYRAESRSKMTLAEYSAIKYDLYELISEEAPNAASEAINSLIRRLMPVIKSGFERIASIMPQQQTEPTAQEEPEEKTVEPTPKASDHAPPAASSEEEVDDSDKEKDELDDDESEEGSKSDDQSGSETGSTDNTGSSSSETGLSNTGSETGSGSEEPPSKAGFYAKKIIKFAESPKKNEDKKEIIEDLAGIGIYAKFTGHGKRIELEVNPQDNPDVSAKTVVDFFESLHALSEPELRAMGLPVSDETPPFYHDPDFYSSLNGKGDAKTFAGITISSKLRKEISGYLSKLMFGQNENYVRKLRLMLSENSEENLNLVLCKRMSSKEKKNFLLNKIKNR